jgi:glycosyltransferase involved in cell wall biosynthesis
MTVLSVVVPVYNEERSLAEFHRRLSASLAEISCSYEIIYSNDGSQDNTLQILQGLRAGDAAIGIINLSRNFGKEAAMTAGIDNTVGDAVIVMDADLQHPPELIGELYRVWREQKVDVVYAQRSSRTGETWMKRQASVAFYKVLSQLSNVDIPSDAGDFRLMSRRVVNALLELRERHRFS